MVYLFVCLGVIKMFVVIVLAELNKQSIIRELQSIIRDYAKFVPKIGLSAEST